MGKFTDVFYHLQRKLRRSWKKRHRMRALPAWEKGGETLPGGSHESHVLSSAPAAGPLGEKGGGAGVVGGGSRCVSLFGSEAPRPPTPAV